jgi:hypothetical protein
VLMRSKSSHPSKHVSISNIRSSTALHSMHAVLNLSFLQAVELTTFIKGMCIWQPNNSCVCVCDFYFIIFIIFNTFLKIVLFLSRQKMLVLMEVEGKRDTFHTMHMLALLVLSAGVKEVR